MGPGFAHDAGEGDVRAHSPTIGSATRSPLSWNMVTAAGGPDLSAEGTMKAGAARGDMPTTPRAPGRYGALVTA